MTKFLNTSTDNTLGGNSPSDDVVSSQKAIKNYVDGVTPTVNNSTITVTQGGVTKGSFTLNQSSPATIALDAGGGSGSDYHPGILSWEWDDHLRNDVQWLRGDTFSWQDGTVYETAYQHLLSDYNNAANQITVAKDKLNNPNVVCTRNASQDAGGYYGWSYQVGNATQTLWTASASPFVGDTVYGLPDGDPTSAWTTVTVSGFGRDTVAGNTIDYRIGQDGHKITTDESTVAQIYATTGVAWYYILDTTNTRFKLPRAKHAKYAANLGVVGNGMSLGVTNGSVNGGLDGNSNYSVYVRQGNYGKSVGAAASGATITNILGVTTDPDNSGIVAQQTQDTDQYKYLYFYVGEFTQTAIENTAGLNAELFNGKVDTGHEVIAFQAPTAANNYTWYRKYRDGWVEQGGRCAIVQDLATLVTLPVTMSDTNYQILITARYDGTTQTGGNGNFTADPASTTQFYWRNGDDFNGYGYWEVKGMAA